MPRLGEAFFYGVRESQLLPREVQDEETPLRFVLVKLQVPSSLSSLDVDLHAFLFEADGTYVDCVFYKNPTLAGKSIKLIPANHELQFDLSFVPERCKFIICTVAVYSGGSILDLREARALLSAIVPSSDSQNYQLPEVKCGSFPADSRLYSKVRLGVLPINPPNGDLTASGLLLSFTPQGLIEPAQGFVQKFGVEGAGKEGFPDGALSLNYLLRGALNGEETNLFEKLQPIRLDGENGGEEAFAETDLKRKGAAKESAEEESTARGPEVHREEAGVSRDSPAEAPPVTSEEARGKLGKGKLEFPDEPLFRDGADEKPAKFKRDKNLQDQTHVGEELFSSLPAEEGFRVAPLKSALEADQLQPRQEIIAREWRGMIESRLGRLERIVESLRTSVATLASATKEMQSNNRLYIEELRGRFLELKADVASDIEKACGESFDALSKRISALELHEAEDAKQLASQAEQVARLDKLVLRSNRDTQLVGQSLSELRHQISGLDGRVALFAQSGGAKKPLNAKHQELPIALELSPARAGSRVKDSTKGASGQGDSAISELENLEKHTEAFGESLRRLASGAAPDGLKGLSEIERKVLAYAGTPKVFDALHELEKAVDVMKLQACGVKQQDLH